MMDDDDMDYYKDPLPYWILFAILAGMATVLLCMVEITVPAIWPLGMTAIAVFTGGYTVIHYLMEHHPAPKQKSVRTPIRPLPSTAPHNGASFVRIGDIERERTCDELREHYAAGRLTMEEIEERLDQALSAKTNKELRVLVCDLPILRSM